MDPSNFAKFTSSRATLPQPSNQTPIRNYNMPNQPHVAPVPIGFSDSDPLKQDTVKWLKIISQKTQWTLDQVAKMSNIHPQLLGNWIKGVENSPAERSTNEKVTQILRTWIKAVVKEKLPELMIKAAATSGEDSKPAAVVNMALTTMNMAAPSSSLSTPAAPSSSSSQPVLQSVTVEKADLSEWSRKQLLNRHQVAAATSQHHSQQHGHPSAGGSADGVDHLVPIKLNIEAEGKTLRDSFLWNTDDVSRKVTPEKFAALLCQDLELGPSFAKHVAAAIREQVKAFHRRVPAPGNESLYKIKLEVRVDDLTLKDQFVWDINNTSNSPEVFARGMVADLRLPYDFVSVISHAIREQIGLVRKGLWESNKEDLSEADPVNTILNPLRPRQEVESWGPKIAQLSKVDLDNIAKQQKRKKPRNE